MSNFTLCNVIAPPSRENIVKDFSICLITVGRERRIEGVSFNGILKEHELLKDYLGRLISFIKLRRLAQAYRVTVSYTSFYSYFPALSINKAESWLFFV